MWAKKTELLTWNAQLFTFMFLNLFILWEKKIHKNYGKEIKTEREREREGDKMIEKTREVTKTERERQTGRNK